MTENELRIGNYVKYKGMIGKVIDIGAGVVTCFHKPPFDNSVVMEEDIHPIELTEEVLEKIGFEGDMYEFCLHTYDANITVNLIENRIDISYYGNFEAELLIKYNVKYLHQLQNAYYCLTNQELEFEL